VPDGVVEELCELAGVLAVRYLRSMSEELKKLRDAIDRIDDELAAALNKRAELAGRIGDLKQGVAAYALSANRNSQKGHEKKASWAPSASRGVREISRPAGARGGDQRLLSRPGGTFSEQAVRKHFGRAVEAVAAPRSTRPSPLRVGGGQFTWFVENSSEGAVGRTLDLLLLTPLKICAESN